MKWLKLVTEKLVVADVNEKLEMLKWVIEKLEVGPLKLEVVVVGQ